MKEIKSIAVIGTGAVGGFYGAKLVQAGFDVHFHARSDADVIRKQGLRILSDKEDDTHLNSVNVYARATDLPECDLVLITIKTTANSHLEDLLKSTVAPGTVICSLQNGYGIESQLERLYPDNPIVGGLCFICSHKKAPGEIYHQDFGSLRLANHNADTATLNEVMACVQSANITTQLAESLEKARWEKLVWNIPFNGLSVLLDATTKEMLDDIHTRALIKDIMLEVILAAQAHGVDTLTEFADTLIEVTDGMSEYYPSMKGDFDNNRPMELMAMYEMPLKAAEDKGVFMPKSQMLFQQLSFVDH